MLYIDVRINDNTTNTDMNNRIKEDIKRKVELYSRHMSKEKAIEMVKRNNLGRKDFIINAMYGA